MRPITRLIVTLAMAPALSWAADCSPKKPEKFVDFLPAFSDSKGFALERTVLPLPLLQWSEGAIDTEGRSLHGPRRSYLSASEYWRWPSLNKYMQDNELLSHVKSQTSTAAAVEVFKEGQEGQVVFNFKVKGGCWYLWQYEVHAS
ncbi:MAG: hypothetical protein QM749_13160 [Aquabacterium sp.]